MRLFRRRHTCPPCAHRPDQDNQRLRRLLNQREDTLARQRTEIYRLEQDASALRRDLTAARKAAPDPAGAA